MSTTKKPLDSRVQSIVMALAGGLNMTFNAKRSECSTCGQSTCSHDASFAGVKPSAWLAVAECFARHPSARRWLQDKLEALEEQIEEAKREAAKPEPAAAPSPAGKSAAKKSPTTPPAAPPRPGLSTRKEPAAAELAPPGSSFVEAMASHVARSMRGDEWTRKLGSSIRQVCTCPTCRSLQIHKDASARRIAADEAAALALVGSSTEPAAA